MTVNPIADFSLRAAKQYLQSAVFIDDNIYNQAIGNPGGGDIEVRLPKPVMRPERGMDQPLDEQSAPDGASESDALPQQPFRTKDLVGSFAKHGIVCALYEPEENFQTGEDSTVFKLCQTADLVVLDWDFHEDGVKGDKPKALIENLIINGNNVVPHHVRLIAIYTNTPSLNYIANSLFQHLDATEIRPEPVEQVPYRLQTGASRVIILGKPGGIDRVELEKEFTVSEKNLADRLLKEFAAMNEGILPSCALLGMAAVRQSSARILDKFHGDLDAQFLFHRALIRDSEEAFDQLPELLGDEFKSVIEDTDYRPEDVTKFIAEACAVVQIKPHSISWKVSERAIDEVLREFLHKPNELIDVLNGDRKPAPTDCQPKKIMESLLAMCSASDADAHRRFAGLLAIRTQYQTKHQDLSFGSIVLNRTSGKYSVCVMPPCDSIRLKDETYFPLWELGISGKGHPIIIQGQDDQWLELIFVVGKPSRYMRLVPFAPDQMKKIVVAKMDTNRKYIFKSQETEFEWIAQLKSSHAQRMANSIGQQLSRVGLTEAEWSRMTFSKD